MPDKSSKIITHKDVSIRRVNGTEKDEHVITIWVHGTGQNPFLKKWHASPPGLLPLGSLPDGWGLRRVAHALNEHDEAEFPLPGFYTFGWSGKLSFSAREIAGKDFHRALRGLQDQHVTRFGMKPRLRVIAHSHGCNVTLIAAQHLSAGEPIVIDELVLLACPVQYATAANIALPVFGSIFALYSPGDMLQIMDPQGLSRQHSQKGGKLFSERRFKPQPNLVQAQIRWKRSRLTHAGFIRERFGTALPSILAELRANRNALSSLSDNHEYVITVR